MWKHPSDARSLPAGITASAVSHSIRRFKVKIERDRRLMKNKSIDNLSTKLSNLSIAASIMKIGRRSRVGPRQQTKATNRNALRRCKRVASNGKYLGTPLTNWTWWRETYPHHMEKWCFAETSKAGFAGTLQHVMARGINGIKIFCSRCGCCMLSRYKHLCC